MNVPNHSVSHAVITAWLRSSLYLSLLSTGLFAASLLLYVVHGGSGSMLLALFLWLLTQYHGYRLCLDKALFVCLEGGTDADLAFDQALAACLNRPAPLRARSLDDRWQGCRLLLQRLGYGLCLQTLCLAWQIW